MTDKIYKTHEEANFLQTEAWVKVNEALGRKVIREEFSEKSSAIMIVKDAKRGRYLEIPGGPLIDWQNKKEVKKVFERIAEIAKEEKCVFVRFRPQLLNSPENRKIIEHLNENTDLCFKPAPFHLHAQNTVILDLQKPLDELLASMRRQTRYDVRRSEKLALRVEKGHSEELYHEFHACQVETAKRQGFIPPTEKELMVYREVFGDDATVYKVSTTEPISGDGKRLLTPEDDHTGAIEPGTVICFGLILKSGPEAAYFEAASTEYGQKLPGACALQWQAIQDLKEAKIKRYNLWGIAPPDPENPGQHLKNHRYSRVTTFKTGFGGEQVNFIPAQDLVISKLRYLVDYLVETIRKHRRHLA